MEWAEGWAKLPLELQLEVVSTLSRFTRAYGSARRVCRDWNGVLPKMNLIASSFDCPCGWKEYGTYSSTWFPRCGQIIAFDEIEKDYSDGDRIEFLKGLAATEARTSQPKKKKKKKKQRWGRK